MIEVKETRKLMGNIFHITALHESKDKAQEAVQLGIREIQRIENVFSTFKDSSEIMNINKNAFSYPVKVSDEVYTRVHKCIQLSETTQGAFDITFGSVAKDFLNFNLTMKQLPDKAWISKNMDGIGYKNIVLDEQQKTIQFLHPKTQIGFGAIGKGYAADRAKKIMCDFGIANGLVDASGDMTAWGKNKENKDWVIGLTDPQDKANMLSFFALSNYSVATSGDYEKYIFLDGKKYSHTINPKTGLPVQGIQSVTVISPSAELSDALTTPIWVMGKSVGLHFVNQLPSVHCMIIDDENKIFFSHKLKPYLR